MLGSSSGLVSLFKKVFNNVKTSTSQYRQTMAESSYTCTHIPAAGEGNSHPDYGLKIMDQTE